MIDVYPNNTLGEEAQVYDGVRTGTIEMGVCGVVMQTDVPMLTILQMPFLFKNFDHAEAVSTGEIGAQIVSGLLDVGVKCFPVGTSGFRVIASNKKVEKIEDMKGLKLRMPPSENMVKIGNAMGASAMAMPMGEVFSGLEQHVIDAADNPYTVLRAQGWYEVTRYLIDTNHVFTPDELIINLKLFNSMSQEHQKLLDECGVDYAAYNWSLVREGTKNDMEYLGKKCTLIIPSEQFRADLRKATQGVYEDYFKKVPEARAIVQKINEMAAEY
jgi:tripartite ATP-independent transporter DctP family solute receptor